MKSIILCLLFTSTVFAQKLTNFERIEQITELNHFTFGSCNSQKRVQPMWNYIRQLKPQFFMWGGDNIYGDTTDPLQLKYKYHIQNAVTDYQELKKEMPILGIWDDHDYGQDNATHTNPIKERARELFYDFIEEPQYSLRRTNDGIYTSYEFGPIERRVKMILLDNRFHHSAPGANLLGAEQWQWFEDEIKNSNAKIHFIVAGLSVLSPKIPKTEEWEDHPRALNKMLGILNRYNPPGVVFLTGDKHFSSIFKRHGYLEFMNSGLTHTVPTRALRAYVARFYPLSFFGLTFGRVQIKWIKNQPILNLQIRARRDEPVFEKEYILNGEKQWKES
jgi:alkaline phosphatase D